MSKGREDRRRFSCPAMYEKRNGYEENTKILCGGADGSISPDGGCAGKGICGQRDRVFLQHYTQLSAPGDGSHRRFRRSSVLCHGTGHGRGLYLHDGYAGSDGRRGILSHIPGESGGLYDGSFV